MPTSFLPASSRPALSPATRWMIGLLAIVCATWLTACTAPKPVMPDGSSRVPVNSDERISAYKAKRADELRGVSEQRRLEREVDDLRQQVADLRAATIVLAADAEGKATSPLPKPPSSLTASARHALAGVAPTAQLVLAPPPSVPLPAISAPEPPAVARSSNPIAKAEPLVVARNPEIPPASVSLPVGSSAHPVPVAKAAATLPSAPTDLSPFVPPALRAFAGSGETLSGKGVAPTPVPNLQDIEVDDSSMLFRIAQRGTGSLFVPGPEVIERLLTAARRCEQIEIRGRTDEEVQTSESLQLATDRAVSARDWLIARGVPRDRIWINALGAGGFVADNRTAQGRAANRRVEIQLTGLAAQTFGAPSADPQPPTAASLPAPIWPLSRAQTARPGAHHE